jgi:hypothetical protein
MTNYLRFPDETTFRSAAFVAGFYNESEGDNPGGYIQYTHDHAMDIVGILFNNDAIVNPETGEIASPATPMEGWHVNFIGTLPDGWGQYLVAPQNPRRKFAGDN